MWTNARDELRRLLDDGDKDKLRFQKQIIGNQDGNNVNFKTFEFRRVTDLSSEDAPFGVFINGTKANVTTDFPENGAFVLAEAPLQTDEVRATYYVKFFLDEELDQFLSTATRWLISSDDVSTVEPGLQPAILKYASAEAYQKLATRFINHLSETYRLEDVPDKDQEAFIKGMQDVAVKYKDEALKVRTEFYATRQGQALQPLFTTIAGQVPDNVPIR